MEIEFKGANCVVIKNKQATFVIDPNLSSVGLKDQIGKATAQLVTRTEFEVPTEDLLTIKSPGDYELSNVTIVGVAAQAHTDTPDEGKRATMYRIDTGEVSIAVVGHVVAPLTEEQLEGLGLVDIAIVPVGGNGYTLDAHAAVQVVRQLDPKVVIPTHYADKGVNYEVPQAELEPFTKELGVAIEVMPKFKVKGAALPETLTVVTLERTA
jgi:L-ascorbate metabolism protein UlaG (beta-lactamase superfamily)